MIRHNSINNNNDNDNTNNDIKERLRMEEYSHEAIEHLSWTTIAINI